MLKEQPKELMWRKQKNMKSLETTIRNFMIQIGMECNKMLQIKDELTVRGDVELIDKLNIRLLRLSELSSECLLNIDKEIGFFSQNNFPDV